MEKEEANGQRYLLALPDAYSTLELCQVAHKLEPTIESVLLKADPNWKGNARKPSTNNAKIVALLGHDLIPLEKAIRDSLDVFLARDLLKRSD
jgi:hypothetical protein